MSKTWETLGVLNSPRKKLRVASTSPDNTEIICALGGADNLVGISRHCDYPAHLQEELPIISDFAQVDLDALKDLEPDLVFCSTYYQAEMVKSLAENHMRVFVTQPQSLESIFENIQIMANLLGRPEKGELLVESMMEKLVPQPANGLRVYAEEWGDPIVPAAPWIQEIIALAGGTPVFQELMTETHTRDRIITAEKLRNAKPDVILLPWCGVHGRIPMDKLSQRDFWSELPAVQKQQVFPLEDSYFVRPGPRLVQGYQILVELFETCGVKQVVT